MQDPTPLHLPPWRLNSHGHERRVGVELEFIGVGVDEASVAVAAVVGGPAEPVSRYEALVHGDDAGPWRVELDFAYLKERGRQEAQRDGSPAFLEEVSEAVVRAGAEAVVPVEVVSPPLRISELTKVQELVPRLRRRGAEGTRAGVTYAFGMQLNPELPSLDAATILRYLRAFLCLQDWLVHESRIDLTRRLTGYSEPYPTAYADLLLDEGYAPDRSELIDDYLEHNPTRNRALDLLPLFAELDEERVRKRVQDELVKARPTFHYRLPNSEIDDPDWGIHVAWNRWLQVEHLSADEERLAGACADYRKFRGDRLSRWFGHWTEGVKPWLVELDEQESE